MLEFPTDSVRIADRHADSLATSRIGKRNCSSRRGWTPNQVITAATAHAAEFLHAKDLGTLEPGKWADLIVLDKNPLDEIRNSRTIHAVYIAGNAVAGPAPQ